MIRTLTSWPVLTAALIAYWFIAFIAIRARTRRQPGEAYPQAAAAQSTQRARNVIVSVSLNISQIVAVLLIGPVALALFRLVALGSLR